MKKKLSKLDRLRREQKKAEADAERFKRRTHLYLTKMWLAQDRLKYYNKQIQKALQEVPPDPTRIVEV